MEHSRATHAGEWAILASHFPGRAPEPIGILLRDTIHDCLQVKLRPGWWSRLPDLEGGEIWRDLGDDIQRQAHDMGAGCYLDWLEATCSHLLQLSHRQRILFQDSAATLEKLYRQEVEPSQSGHERSPQQLVRTISTFRALLPDLNQVFSRKLSRLFFQTHLLLLALAACSLSAIFLVRIKVKPAAHRAAPVQAQALATIQLPPLPHYAVMPALELDSADLPLNRPKKHRVVTPPRKSLQPGSLRIKPHHPQLVKIDTPPPKIELEIKAPAPTVIPVSFPSAPKYRSRNRFVRVLSTLASPFKPST
jgi:hypothetical protein